MNLHSSTFIFKPAKALAFASSALLACSYVAYRLHDRRDLSEKEVEDARHILAELFPKLSGSTVQQHHSDTAQHLSNLDEYGVSVVKETLTTAQVACWNTTTSEVCAKSNNNIVWNSGRAHCSVSKRTSLFSEMARIGENNHSGYNDQDVEIASASSGRRCGIFWRRKPIDSTQTISEQNDVVSLQGIVKSYFIQHKIERYELTDVQFLNAYPNSTNQIWHRDNTCCGLTAIVALKDVRSNGPTELLIGTHKRDFSLREVFHNAVIQPKEAARLSMGRPLLGVIDAGDAILYDARIFHRGRGYRKSNRKSGEDRPVLVLRWDAAKTPPPGSGLIKTTASTYIGCFLYAALSAVQKFTKRKEDAR
ncbi:hypothetical protein ACHAXM_005985 [Skeletonema potamos]|jgi:ectoine hydroxylase-related dioxygenase (phytanoyl-CoA dioxygenase family)